jgi:hypothetical protein
MLIGRGHFSRWAFLNTVLWATPSTLAMAGAPSPATHMRLAVLIASGVQIFELGRRRFVAGCGQSSRKAFPNTAFLVTPSAAAMMEALSPAVHMAFARLATFGFHMNVLP